MFYSYYGGLICVCWSPDGKYVLTGGQDDLISIWCPSESALIARCQGHHSWVTSVAFDPWRCDDKIYRFGSVGEDCRLCLWDFSVGMLHRPKAVAVGRYKESRSLQTYLRLTISNVQASIRHRGSMGPPIQRTETQTSRLRSDSNISTQADDEEDDEEKILPHPVEPRARTATLPPVCVSAPESPRHVIYDTDVGRSLKTSTRTPFAGLSSLKMLSSQAANQVCYFSASSPYRLPSCNILTGMQAIFELGTGQQTMLVSHSGARSLDIASWS